MTKKINITNEEKYRMFLVENIRVASQMLYEMAYDIAGKTDHICTIDTSANITSINVSGLDGLKKVASDIIPD